jgi:hypothetical protein
MTRFMPFWIALAALLLPLGAGPALASTAGWSEKIDLVRDLPNGEPFEHDGRYFDLGYLWSSKGSANTGYVLYHDDQYVVLDDEKLSLVKEYLGEDPTAGYVPPAGAAPQGARRVTDDDYRNWRGMAAKGTPMASRDDLPRSTAPASRWTGGALLSFLFVGVGIAVIRRQFRTRTRKMLREVSFVDQPTGTAMPSESFEARIAARLAELQGDGAPPPTDPIPVTTPVRGFGRKLA